MVPSRECDVLVMRFILRCLSTLRRQAVILDTSATMGSTAVRVGDGLDAKSLERIELHWLSEDASAETHLAFLVEEGLDVILIDDINSLHHLLSGNQGKLGMYRLLVFSRLLSYSARQNGSIVISTAYSSEVRGLGGGQVSLSAAGDMKVAVKLDGPRLVFKSATHSMWGGGSFVAEI